MEILVVCPRPIEQITELKSQNMGISYLPELQKADFAEKTYDYVFLDLDALIELHFSEEYSPSQNYYKNALSKLETRLGKSKIIMMAHPKKIRDCVACVKAGASNYIHYPVEPAEVKYVLEEEEQKQLLKDEIGELQEQLWEKPSFFQTKSSQVQNIYNLVRSVAPTRSTVLITGESGTGKSYLAKMIHDYSNRKSESFISVHCGAIPEGLVESELFGHEKGAFTGAHKKKLGKFELADKGSIFLDEIGTINLNTQIKLLQVLQDKSFQRVGGEETVDVDVRVIAATNIHFQSLLERGEFREDLYYRLNVFPIEMPPLRERKEDIPDLVDFFIKKFNRENARQIKGIQPEVLGALQVYPWPGNIRELENVIERAFIIETSEYLTAESFPLVILDSLKIAPVPLVQKNNELSSLAEVRKVAIESVERNYIKEILFQTKGRINQSAEIAGVTTRQFHKLLNKYGINRKDFL